MFKEIKHCRICGNPNLAPVIHMGNQHLTGIFPHKKNAGVLCGPLEVVRCAPADGRDACGLVQLHHDYDPSDLYGDHYGYRSSLNASMATHLRQTVEEIVKIVAPRAGDLVLDIGSNDGTLLGCYPATGPTLVGIDPTGPKFHHFYRADIRLIPDFFSADLVRANLGSAKAKIVTSIAMFYDLPNPMAFAKQVAEVLADDGVWHMEQSYMPFMLERVAYDTICHEHFEYYCLSQIKWMADRAGLKIIRVSLNNINGGSFAVTLARNESPYPAATTEVERLLRTEADAGLSTAEPYERFRQKVVSHRTSLLATLKKLKSQGAKVLGYGASTKGNVILQYCGLTTADLPCIAEVNPDKYGAFTPGTEIPIVSEAEAHAMKPDYFLVLPWHFRENLLKREAAYLAGGGKMIFPLPEIDIVSA